MGCGISTLDTKDVPRYRKSTRQQQCGIIPPIAKNNYCISPNMKNSKNGDKGVAFVNNNNNEVNLKSIIFDDEKLMQRKELGSNDEEENSREKYLVEEKRALSESKGKEKCDMHAKNVKNNIVDIDDEHEEENKDRDDSFVVMASPSFRDYWINYDFSDQSSVKDSNSSDSVKNFSDDDSTNIKNKMKTEEHVNCSKEYKKKEEVGEE